MLKISFTLLFTLFLMSCSDSNTNESDGPLEIEDVVGSYSLSELTKTEGGQTLDLLEIGVRINLTFNADNSLEGVFFTPDTLNLLEEDMEGDLTLDLSGTYTLSSDKINIQTDMDLYFNDAVWTTDGNKIYTDDFVHTVFIKD